MVTYDVVAPARNEKITGARNEHLADLLVMPKHDPTMPNQRDMVLNYFGLY
jgi:hypothetical protein